MKVERSLRTDKKEFYPTVDLDLVGSIIFIEPEKELGANVFKIRRMRAANTATEQAFVIKDIDKLSSSTTA